MYDIEKQVEQRFADIVQSGNLFKCEIWLGLKKSKRPHIKYIDIIKKNDEIQFIGEKLNNNHLNRYVYNGEFQRSRCSRDIYEIFSEACKIEKIDNNTCVKIFDKDTINDLYNKKVPYVQKDIFDKLDKILNQFESDHKNKIREEEKNKDAEKLMRALTKSTT